MNISNVLQEIKELSELEQKQVPEMFIKFNEEFGEFAAEVMKMLGYSAKHKHYDEEHLIEEMADAMQCLLCLYLKICNDKNILIEQVFETITVKNKKWKTVICEINETISPFISSPNKISSQELRDKLHNDLIKATRK